MIDRETLDDVDEKAIAEVTPDRTQTLPDLQYLYGQLYLLGRYGGEGGEVTPYLTPGAAEGFAGEEESLVTVRVDLSGDTPSIEEVRVGRYTEDMMLDVAHARTSSGRAVDHGITHMTSANGNEPEKVGEYAADRFTRWPNEDAVAEVGERRREGWIIDDLRELGESDALMESLAETVAERLDDETAALVTVQIRRVQDAEWKFPGEVDVLCEALMAQARAKMLSTNEATDAVGESVDMVTGEEGEVVGVADDPMNYYRSKQQGHYPGFDPDEAWRTHPLAERTALVVNAAGPFLDGFRHSMFGVHVYYLPYFRGEMDIERMRALYAMLREVNAAEDDVSSAVRRVYRAAEERDVGDDLAFWTLVVDQQHALRWNILAEDRAVDGYRLAEAVETHRKTLDAPIYDESNTFASVFPLYDADEYEWATNVTDRGALVRRFADGRFIDRTFPFAVSENDVTADTMRSRAQIGLVTDEKSVDAGWLVEQYVARIEQSADGEGIPETLIGAQLAQMGTLAALGVLDARDDNDEPLTHAPTYMTEENEETDDTAIEEHRDGTEGDGGGGDGNEGDDRGETTSAADDGEEETARDRRERKLLKFIDEHPPLADDERCATFLLGVLVGQLSQYQAIEGRGRTMADKTPVRGVSKEKLRRMLVEAIDKDIAYRTENRYTSLLYSETVRELVEHILRVPIEAWEIPTEQVRYFYALGVGYGLSGGSDSETEEASETEDDAGSTDEEAVAEAG